MTDKFRDDALTLASLGVLAFALADQMHEALGHALATVITGGKLIALTTCYLDSQGGSPRWIPAAGGLANLAVGLIALALLRILPRPSPHLRYFMVLVAAFNMFFAAGYPASFGLTQMDHVPEAYQPDSATPAAEPIRQSVGWIVGACLVTVVFVVILGPGIRFLRE